MKCFLYAFSLFVVVLPATLCAAEIQGKVIRVLDGDTIVSPGSLAIRDGPD